MSQSEFAKWRSCQPTDNDVISCDVCARTIWVAALKCVRNRPRAKRYSYEDLMAYIDAELKTNGQGAE